jgi:hypothetical protein
VSKTRALAEQTLRRVARDQGTRILASSSGDGGAEELRTVVEPRAALLWEHIRVLVAAIVPRVRKLWSRAVARYGTLAVGSTGALAALVIAVALYAISGTEDRTVLPPEPEILTRQPIEQSFGLGHGVDYEAEDFKAFDFEFTAADDAVGILHFQASDISPNEVVMITNGVEIGPVPPDAVQTARATHEIVIPAKLLRKGQKNRIVFDNIRNPPGHESWRIWNLWIEVYLLPRLSPEGAAVEAGEAFRRGQHKWDRRDVDAGNRHGAWKEFRNAWLILEGHPEPKSVELYGLARQHMKDAQRELDRTCDKLLLEAEGEFQHRKLADARATLDQVRKYFPDRGDQPCWRRAERKWLEYGL